MPAEPIAAPTAAEQQSLSLYTQIGRDDWSRMAAGVDQPLSENEIVQLRGLGDMLDPREVREVYLPLSKLLSLYASSIRRLGADRSSFLGEPDSTTPFVVGVAGSVAVGKSTIARLLREKLYKIPGIRHSQSHFVLRVLKEASVPLG